MRRVGSVGCAAGILAWMAAGSGYAQERGGLWGAYEAMSAPLLGEALGEAARHAPFALRVGKWSAEEQGERVALKLPLYLERADAGAHRRALELLRLFAAREAPKEGASLAPVRYWVGGQAHSFWVTPAALRIAGLSGEGEGRTMGSRLALRVIWRDGQGRALAEQSASAPVSASCAGLPVESMCRGCGEALELGARLTKQVEGQAGRAEVESCALEIEASVSAARWAQTARVEVVLAGASAEEEVAAVKEPGGRGLWPLAAASGVCAVSTRGGKQRELVSWRYDARGWPVAQRGWGTQTGQRRYVYDGERLVEVWDGAEQVERVVYDGEGRLLGTWTAQRRCGEQGCEETQLGRSVWVTSEDGQRERLEVEGEAPGGLTSYTLERRAGRWEAVSARGPHADVIHGALVRQVLERESFLKLAARGEVRRLRVQASPRAGGDFDALVLGHDAQERPMDGVYVEHRRGASRVAAIQIDRTSCHGERAAP